MAYFLLVVAWYGGLIEISDLDCTRVERKTSMLFHVNTDTMEET